MGEGRGDVLCFQLSVSGLVGLAAAVSDSPVEDRVDFLSASKEEVVVGMR